MHKKINMEIGIAGSIQYINDLIFFIIRCKEYLIGTYE